jgi:hypothetical protein
MSCEEEDTCHGRRRTHVTGGGGHMSYEEEDTCHVRRRTHVICCCFCLPPEKRPTI